MSTDRNSVWIVVAVAAAALLLSEGVAAIVPGALSLSGAAGAAVVALQPTGAKELATSLFGTAAKGVLQLLAAAIGLGLVALLAQRRPRAVGPAAWAAGFMLTGSAIYWGGVPWIWSIAAVAAPALLAGRLLTRKETAHDGDRRAFLRVTGGMAIAGGLALLAGRSPLRQLFGLDARGSSELPVAVISAPPPTGAQSFAIEGISPIITPVESFYRIDTSLSPPAIDATRWSMRIEGMVERPLELTYDDLRAEPQVEIYSTMSCISNEVGGDLVGTAKWSGVSLQSLLARVGIQAGATQLFSRSVDGWSAGFPLEWALAPERQPLIAIGMNDEPLTREHGFPARLVVPGLFGYVSATKWLDSIVVNRFEDATPYWLKLGWVADGKMETQSRIEVPGYGSRLVAGAVQVAGTAWAPDRGVRAVEISIDGGPWSPTDLSVPLSSATWVQWRATWQATLGRHEIRVRTTDGFGEVQPTSPADGRYDGLLGAYRGYHTINVNVEG